MKTFDKVLMITWVLNVYDIIVTLVGVHCLNGDELNPIMRAALNVGPTFFVASKLSVHAAVCWTLDRRLERHPKKTWTTLVVVLLLFVVAALWNSIVLMSMH
ncbi:MAG: DUF5658 family protein [Nitrospira sp.]